ncbi:MAG: hypothetical protein KC776_32925, partial [Myxococcales bacterium]|nr:hypothetical protein [Myxococcales bacterium]
VLADIIGEDMPEGSQLEALVASIRDLLEVPVDGFDVVGMTATRGVHRRGPRRREQLHTVGSRRAHLAGDGGGSSASVEIMIQGRRLDAMVLSEIRCNDRSGFYDVALLVFRPAPPTQQMAHKTKAKL